MTKGGRDELSSALSVTLDWGCLLSFESLKPHEETVESTHTLRRSQVAVDVGSAEQMHRRGVLLYLVEVE